MQIITGKYRARKLVAVEGDSTRPTLARVKESIFNLKNYQKRPPPVKKQKI